MFLPAGQYLEQIRLKQMDIETKRWQATRSQVIFYDRLLFQPFQRQTKSPRQLYGTSTSEIFPMYNAFYFLSRAYPPPPLRISQPEYAPFKSKIKYIISISTLMKQSHILTIIALAIVATVALPEPVYTIHYVKSYRHDLINQYFGCSKAIVYGTYLYPLGPVDALYALMNSHIYGFNGGCQRKNTYIKIFGDAQDYDKILQNPDKIAEHSAQTLTRANTKNLIIDWKYLPQSGLREKGRKALEQIINGFKNKGFNVILKAPASYFCLNVSGRKYILNQPANEFIIQLYGQQQGKYTTYQSIFGTETPKVQEGYSIECPKYPTKTILDKMESTRKIYFEKTLDSTQTGYIGPNWETFLTKAGQSKFNNLYFYDGYPKQTVDF